MPYNEDRSLSAIKEVLKTVHRLRAPGGCPWDREQTHQTLRPFLIEETYETIEVMDEIKTPADLQNPKLKNAFIEEWGDVLLQILLNAEVASENDPTITLEQIAQSLNQKLIRRHPHVFGDVNATNSEAVVQNWDKIKKQEKADAAQGETTSSAAPLTLASVHKGLPPLPRTMKVIQKVTKVGFQWPDLAGPLEKLQEEVQELKQILGEKTQEKTQTPDQYLNKVESEIGDVLFSVCNVASFLKLDPEAALRSTLRKFESRFNHVETRLKEKGKTPAESNLEEMDIYWDEAKKMERASQKGNS